LRGRTLVIEPCIPRAWTGFEVTYRFGTSRYRIVVVNPNGVSGGIVRASLDGTEISGRPCEIPLNDDGRHHHGLVTLG
jgi:cyclic beta-1,2-glucan synthetase